MTNFERIKAMPVEEFLRWFGQGVCMLAKHEDGNGTCFLPSHEKCADCVLEYLHREVSA